MVEINAPCVSSPLFPLKEAGALSLLLSAQSSFPWLLMVWVMLQDTAEARPALRGEGVMEGTASPARNLKELLELHF